MKGVRSGVERRRGVSGLKARDERRETPGKVLKKRRSPRVRGRMGTSVRVRRTHLTAGPSAPASRIARVSAMHGRRSRRCTGNVSPSLVVTRTTSLASAASAATESLARVFELATTKPPPRVTTSSRSPSPSACTMNVVRSRATPRKQWYPSVVAAAVAGRVFTDTTRARIGGNASSSPPPPPPSIMMISPAHTHRSRSRAERCAATASPSTSTSASSSSSSSVSSSSSFSSSSSSSSPPPPPPPPFPPRPLHPPPPLSSLSSISASASACFSSSSTTCGANVASWSSATCRLYRVSSSSAHLPGGTRSHPTARTTQSLPPCSVSRTTRPRPSRASTP